MAAAKRPPLAPESALGPVTSPETPSPVGIAYRDGTRTSVLSTEVMEEFVRTMTPEQLAALTRSATPASIPAADEASRSRLAEIFSAVTAGLTSGMLGYWAGTQGAAAGTGIIGTGAAAAAMAMTGTGVASLSQQIHARARSMRSLYRLHGKVPVMLGDNERADDRNVGVQVCLTNFARCMHEDCSGNNNLAQACTGEALLEESFYVSTVFLGIDYSFGRGDGRPILFESLVFGGKFDGRQNRYATWDEAEAGHAEMVQDILRELGLENRP